MNDVKVSERAGRIIARAQAIKERRRQWLNRYDYTDPAIEAANKRWNAGQYAAINPEGGSLFDQYWREKMRQKYGNTRENNKASPQQRTRSLEEIIWWWKANNPHMKK